MALTHLYPTDSQKNKVVQLPGMALQAVYKQFLAAPEASLLADDAALHYVTTTTSFRGSANIVKHLTSLRNQVKKKQEEYLTVIEGQNALAIEVDTILEFVTSGAAYLPGMDDNFLADRTVYLPVTHIVTFNSEGRLQQIRQSWDQGSLLKQLDIIGKTGRNWPIRDAKDQIKLIASSLQASGSLPAAESSTAARGRGNSNNALRDPHASLALFAPREEIEQQNPASVISPRGGPRPRQRDFAEILGDEPVNAPGSPSAGRGRPDSAIAPKVGAGKNYQANRLFDTEGELADDLESTDEGKSPDRFYRPNPKKYNHFDFADGSDPQDAPNPGEPTPLKTKHTSQWGFDDFTTPAKPRPGKALQKNHQDVRHWGNPGDSDVQESVRKPANTKPRRDAEPHFEFVDDGLSQGEPRAGRPRGATHNNGLGLYKNNVYSEEGQHEGDDDADAADQHALGNITNLKSRGKTFQSQFSMTDDSPARESGSKHVGQDRQKAVKMMDANWSSYDQSPAQKENKPVKPKATGKERGIHIGGDGMGGSRGTNRDWLFGGDEEEEPAKALPTRKQNAAKSGGFNWDF